MDIIYLLEKKISITIVNMPNKNDDLSFRFKYFTDLIRVNKFSKRKTIKKLFKEFSVPPWERKRTPLLFYNKNFISALGVFVSYLGKIKLNCRALLIYWKKNK